MNLKESKDKLAAALGDDMKTYLEYLRLWFRQKVSREEFESRTRRLLKHQHLLRLHNEFILDLLAECQNFTSTKALSPWSHAVASTSSSSSIVPQTKRRKIEPTIRLEAYPSPADSLMHVTFGTDSSKLGGQLRPNSFPSYCSNDLLLPDVSLVAGRARITAWLHGLSDGATDDACRMIVVGCDHLLKRIITSAIMSSGSDIHRRCGPSGPHTAPFGRPVHLKPNTPWPERLFDAIYPELNLNNYAIDNSQSLLSVANYREVVEAQEAQLLAFASNDNKTKSERATNSDEREVLTLDRIKNTLHLAYLDLNLPSNFQARCLVRINAATIQR